MGMTARLVFFPAWGLRIAALLAVLVLAVGLDAARLGPAGVGIVRAPGGVVRGLLALPVAAQGVVSADLGRADSRYRVHRVGGLGRATSLWAANPGQGFGERFSSAGVTLSSGRARFSLGLAGVGRRSRTYAPPRVAARTAGNRVSYERSGVREWFANGPLGAPGDNANTGAVFSFVYAPPAATAPGAPLNVVAVPGDEQATVSFTAPVDNGSPITRYTVIADPGGVTTTSLGHTATVRGLTNTVPYRFTVTATNAIGTGPPSEPSAFVVPLRRPADVFILGQQKLGKDGTLALRVYVDGPGAVSARQASMTKTSNGIARRASSRTKSRHHIASYPALIGSGRAISKGSSVVTLLLKPTSAARRALRARRRVKVPILVTFSPPNGQPSSQETTVELDSKGRPLSTPSIGWSQPSQRFSFEYGLAGWESAWGDLTIASSAVEHFSGAHTLQITIHANPLSAVNATYDPSGSMSSLTLGSVIYMWVYRPSGTPSVAVVPMVREGPAWTFCPGGTVKPPANTWYQISLTVGNCTGSATGTTPGVRAVGVQIDDLGGAANGKSVYLDQVSW